MTILCGTDFTPAAAEAVRVAALWCRATSEELVLAHALGEESDEPRARIEAQLAAESAALVEGGVGSRCALGTDPIDSELVRIARECAATLVVLGALGQRAGGSWKLGSTVDHVAMALRVPLVVVRAPAPLLEWLEGRRTLSAAIAYDASPAADAALAWAAALARIAPVRLVALHSYGLNEHCQKRGIRGPLPIGFADARIEEPLALELGERMRASAPGSQVRLVLRGGLGRPADQLVDMAAECACELLVIGNHHRAKLERAWRGSVTRGLIELAPASVACISAGE
ncbi:MAG: universal stress protein [Planctomycetes bacterium]|nr:universal stress protein [Planctomycetota bacterium]